MKKLIIAIFIQTALGMRTVDSWIKLKPKSKIGKYAYNTLTFITATIINLILSPFLIWGYLKSLKDTPKMSYQKEKEVIRKKYKDKKLFRTGYTAKVETTVNNFLEPEDLLFALWEIENGESDLTEAGLKMLKETYGLDQLVDLFMNDQHTEEGRKSESKRYIFEKRLIKCGRSWTQEEQGEYEKRFGGN
jgi:hypothetical protein